MLEPNSRKLLLDCLQPPLGFTLDQAVGTTYTLDLYALLSVPVAFAFREALTDDGRVDPLATLEALRRHAANIHVFCQSGAIHVPRGQEALFAYLEDSVIPVAVPREGGVFHPKTWLLRFAGGDGVSAYRFVCLSRNLTFDRSWDTALVLDGLKGPHHVREPDAGPLAAFISALPDLAVQGLGSATQAAIDQMAAELPYVRFELPADVESLRFWPLGIARGRPPDFTPAHRPLLVVSPFLSEDWLQHHLSNRRGAKLISRDDQLCAMPVSILEKLEETYTLLQEATPEEDVEAQAEDETLLEGLHAKLFVMDDGWNTRIWTGSANATKAAFHRNVEMLVELVGKKSRLGIDKLMGEDSEESGFRQLLESWSVPDDEMDEHDPVIERLDERLHKAREKFAKASLSILISPHEDEASYVWCVDGDWPEVTGVSGELWPIGLRSERAQALSGARLVFDGLTIEALSAFAAVTLSAKEGGQQRSSRFVLKLPAQGFPDDRAQHLLRNMLGDRDKFLRLLMILLADDGIEAIRGLAGAEGEANLARWLPGAGDMALLESLLRSLDRSPERLDQIDRLLRDMGTDQGLDSLVPPGFAELWEAVWANRTRANSQ